MIFTPEFLGELRDRVSLAEVVGRRVRLMRSGRELHGLCPFHNEKTPSFTVTEDKGFYHCFGCGAHGDVVEFVRRIDGLSFPEAVERLAAGAGLALPDVTPAMRRAAVKQASLQEVLEAAARWYEARLAGPDGEPARRYLGQRGLSEAAIIRFRLGFAPRARTALKTALGRFPEPLLREAGLLAQPESGATFDYFRDRVMFPIGDRLGRVIGFGARALGDIKPKYLNSPETPVFHKGRVLYNLSSAREAARTAGTLVVVEGYMDVIAMVEAGLGHAVAPLGTALGETQMQLLWRFAAEPILCFDGDPAGLRAAAAAAERCLPLLKPGHSFRFAFLPAGEDPDSMIRRQGVAALGAVLASAEPLAERLWRQARPEEAGTIPERRAAVQAGFDKLVGRISDRGVRENYKHLFKNRLWEAYGQKGGGTSRKGGVVRTGPGSADRVSPIPLTPPRKTARREEVLVLTVLHHPELLDRMEEDFAAIEFSRPELDKLRQAILEETFRNPGLDGAGLTHHLSAHGFGDLISALRKSLDWVGPRDRKFYSFARLEAAPDEALAGWQHVLARHQGKAALQAELRLAEARLAEQTTEENFRRVQALKEHLAARRGDEAFLDELGTDKRRGSVVG